MRIPLQARCLSEQWRVQAFSLGHDRRPRMGVRFLGRGSNPLPTSCEVCGSAVSSPAGFMAELQLLKGFPLFTALRMVSVVNCGPSHSHWGARPPWPPYVRPFQNHPQNCVKALTYGETAQERMTDWCN